MKELLAAKAQKDALKKTNYKPFVKVDSSRQPKRTFNPGKPQNSKIPTLSMGSRSPQGT